MSTIELSDHITGLGVNADDPENPLLTVYFEQRQPPMIIKAATGRPFDSDNRDLAARTSSSRRTPVCLVD